MLNLSDILQFIIDGFDNGPFPCQQPVRHAHDGSLHVALQLRYQLDSVNEQPLEELLADVSLVTDEPAVEELHESLVAKRLVVINVTGGDHEIKELALLVADEVKLETDCSKIRHKKKGVSFLICLATQGLHSPSATPKNHFKQVLWTN